MNKADAELTLDIVGMALQFGVPLVQELIKDWSSSYEVTPAMVQELKASIKDASKLFEETD